MAKRTTVKSRAVPKKTSKKSRTNPVKVSFDYIKSNYFRVIRVDVAHGGVTPKGNMIQMALFSERQSIPKKETFALENGQLGERTGIEKREAIIREVEIEMIMDLPTAKSISSWFREKIELAEKMSKEE